MASPLCKLLFLGLVVLSAAECKASSRSLLQRKSFKDTLLEKAQSSTASALVTPESQSDRFGSCRPVSVFGQAEEVETSADGSTVSVIHAAQISGNWAMKSGGYVEPSAKCYAASPPCGILEFRMACSSETTVSFRAELVAPNGNSDSMYVGLKDGTAKTWHTGNTDTWGWSPGTSPELTAPKGVSSLQFMVREVLKARAFKFHKGSPQCHWLVTCDNANEVALVSPQDSTPYWQVECCPIEQEFCAGCARLNAGKTACEECSGGYTKTSAGTCTACADVPGWENKAGENCYAASCSNELFQGFSSNTACCKCGGGQEAATKFAYYVGPMALGSAPVGHPIPRTAQRYAVDQACELSKYGLSIDPSTGVLKLAPGCSSVGCGTTATIEVKCTVTAFQSNGLSSSAPLVVTAGHVGYGPSVVLHQGRSASAPPAAVGSGSFALSCAPQASDWLKVDSSTGVLSLTASAAGGALTDLNQNNMGRGGVCTVSRGTSSGQVMVLAPKPWTSMSYSYGTSTLLYATVGERSPVLPVKGSSGLAPTRYAASCAGNAFAFDTLTGVATWEGHVIFALDVKTGGLQMQPEDSLTKTLDATDVNAVRRKINLQCTVLGHYEWLAEQGPVLTHRIQLELRDPTCWAKRRLSFARKVDKGSMSTSACRSSCRSGSCSHYAVEGGKCYFYSALCIDSTTFNCVHKDRWVYEHYPGCGERGSCIDISLPGYHYVSGKYCPRGENVEVSGQGPVYFKQGLTKQETFWLQRYDTGRNAGCNGGDWAILKPDPTKDFENLTMGYVELHGAVVACVTAGQADLPSDVFSKVEVDLTVTKISTSGARSTVAAPGCETPNVTNEEKEEAEAEEDEQEVYPLVFNDPSTDTSSDHWLHPCECVPADWGGVNPVAGESLAEVPAGSHNEFLPPPIQIVEGEFTCPQASLTSIHVASDDDLYDGATCKTMCTAQECAFYWEGEVMSTKQCRIFSACSELVRELGLTGILYGLVYRKSCRIANPEVCWKVTKRRSFLGAGDDFGECHFQDLMQQCDHKLMLGGMGVSVCGKCSYAPVRGRRITGRNGNCMDDAGDNVKLHSCHGNANQRWYFDGEALKSDKTPDLCLDYHPDNGNVYPHPCNSGPNQKWYMDGLFLKSRKDDKCLDYHPSNENVYVGNCPGSNTQHFGWRQGQQNGGRQLSSDHDSKCMKVFDDGNVKMTGCAVAMAFRFYHSNENIKSERNPSECMEDNTVNSQIQVANCHGGNNQKFYFNGKELKNRWDNRCMDFNVHGDNNIYMGNCPNSNTQKWGFHDVEKPLPMAEVKIMSEHSCLDAGGDGNVYMATCHGGNNQKWYMDGEQFKNGQVGGCMDEDGDGNLYMHTCHNGDNQKFFWVSGQIKNRKWGNARCADMNGDKNLYMHPCHGGANQQFNWKIPRRLKSRANPSLCVEITASNNAQLYPCHRRNNQLFFFEGDELRSQKDVSKCIDMNSGNNLYLYNCHGGSNQKFFWDSERLKVKSDTSKCFKADGQSNANLEAASCANVNEQKFFWDSPHYEGRLLKNQDSDMCADRDGEGNVYLSPCHSLGNQRFYFDGERLKLDDNSGECLDVSVSAGNGNVYMHACHSENNQKWYVSGERIKSRLDNRCLDVNTRNNNLFLGSCSGSNTQKWSFGEDLHNSRQLTIGGGKCLRHMSGNKVEASGCYEHTGSFWYFDGERLKSLVNERCMDVHTAHGDVYMATCHSGDNQKFYFEGNLVKNRMDARCLDYNVPSGNVYTGSCPGQDTASFTFESGKMLKKTPLPKEYLHGQTLDISCWSERYSSPSTESLSCLAGTWLNSRGSLGLNGFSCAACVQVVTPRYADLDSQIKQELFFAGGLQLHLTVDTRTRKSVTSGGALQSGSNQDAFVAELLPDAPETERRYRALSTGHCLTETAGQLSSSACGRDAEPDQLLEAGELGALMWNEFKAEAEIPGPSSNPLYNRGSAPTTLRSFQLQGNCGYHAMTSLGFNHGQQLGLSASCTPASTYADPVEHYLDLPGAVEINSVSHGTCMSIQQIIPWTLVDRMYNRCMDHHPTNGNVYAHACHGGSNQKWFMVEGAIISMHGGKFECLDYHTGTENVYMHECHGNSNQRWYIDPDTANIRSEYDHRCLDIVGDGSYNIYIHPCHNNGNQKFDAHEQSGSKFNLALHLQCSGHPGEQIKVEPIGNQNKFRLKSVSHTLPGEFQYDGNKQRIKNLQSGKCLGSHAIFVVKEEDCMESIDQEWVIGHGLQGLADAPMVCESNQVLSYVEKGHGHIRYKCVHVSALSTCSPGYSEQVDTKALELEDIRALKRMSATCEEGHGLRSITAEASDKGAWIRLRYECCRISRVPVSMYPFMINGQRAFDSAMAHPWEGMYCPSRLDDSGRMSFAQTRSFKPSIPGFSAKVTSSSRTLGDQLTFEVQGSEYSMSTYRGMNVMVFTSAGSRESVQTFDTHSTGSEALKNFIEGLANGKVILVAAKDDAQGGLNDAAKDALRSCGATKIDSLTYRGSYALIGVKGGAAMGEEANPDGTMSVASIGSLSYNKYKGEWCVAGKGCVSNDMVHPLDSALKSEEWHVVPVSDFDAVFEAKGTKPLASKKRKVPPLIKFGASDPDYLPECKDESHPGARKFKLELMNKEAESLDDENPCKNVFGKAPKNQAMDEAEGMTGWIDDLSGTTGPGQGGVTYKSVKECSDRDIVRELKLAKWDQENWDKTGWFPLLEDLLDAIGSVIPNVEAAPLGAGFELEPGEFTMALAGYSIDAAQFAYDNELQKRIMHFEQAGHDDCNPIQHGFARTFCDLHCIRDAVRKGDDAILRALEEAVEVIGKNTQLLLEHFVGEGSQGGLLEEGEQLKKGIAASVNEMFLIAQQATLEPRASLAATRAIQGFTQRPGNATLMGFASEIRQLHGQVTQLSQRKLSQTDEVQQYAMQMASQMGKYMQAQAHVLGVYRHGAEEGKHLQKRLKRSWRSAVSSKNLLEEIEEEASEQAMEDFDAMWWELRQDLDHYLQASQAYVEATKEAVKMLQGYSAHCKADFADLKMAYARSSRAERKAHAALRKGWAAATGSLGEMASKVVDGNILARLAAHDLRSSELLSKMNVTAKMSFCAGDVGPAMQLAAIAMRQGLFGQTTRQLAMLFGELAMFEGRFQSGGLGEAPDAALVKDAEARLQKAVVESATAGKQMAKTMARRLQEACRQ